MSKKKIKLVNGQTPDKAFLEKAVETLQALVNWKYECAIEDVADEMDERRPCNRDSLSGGNG